MLVCRHEPDISGTTDVLERFPGRAPEVWEFTLAELRTLRARERLPELRSTEFDGRFGVPTFAELLDLAAGYGCGVYPETKLPGAHRARWLDLEPLVAPALRGWTLPAYLQSFAPESLEAMRPLGFPLVQLTSSAVPPIEAVAGRFDAIGPPKAVVDEALVAAAHGAGLEVHPYTFRRENAFLPEDLRSSDDPAAVGDWRAEYERMRALGVDAVFTDNPDLAAEVLSPP